MKLMKVKIVFVSFRRNKSNQRQIIRMQDIYKSINLLIFLYNQIVGIMNKANIAKVIVLGDSAVGKTSILKSLTDHKIGQAYKATIGADFIEHEVIVDGKFIKLDIWDTAGQEKFKSLGEVFYRGSTCCILVYDITDHKSFDHIQTWISDFIDKGHPESPEKFPFILVGNKIDLEEERTVDSQSIRQFLSLHPNIQHFQTSAKSRNGVIQLFEKVALTCIVNTNTEIFIPMKVNTTKLTVIKKNNRKTTCCST